MMVDSKLLTDSNQPSGLHDTFRMVLPVFVWNKFIQLRSGTHSPAETAPQNQSYASHQNPTERHAKNENTPMEPHVNTLVPLVLFFVRALNECPPHQTSPKATTMFHNSSCVTSPMIAVSCTASTGRKARCTSRPLGTHLSRGACIHTGMRMAQHQHI